MSGGLVDVRLLVRAISHSTNGTAAEDDDGARRTDRRGLGVLMPIGSGEDVDRYASRRCGDEELRIVFETSGGGVK